MINSNTKICCVIGDPVNHSLSPLLHNSGYKSLGKENEFAYVAYRVGVNKIPEAIEGIRSLGIRGVSVTIPHKLQILDLMDSLDDSVQKIGAANTIVNTDGKLFGTNTDYLGYINPLNRVTDIEGKKVAILGAGGAARSAVYGVLKEGASACIFNRTVAKAEALAKEFGCEAESLKNISKIQDYDIVINSTSSGMNKDDKSLISQENMDSKQIFFDSIYNQYETDFMKNANAVNAKVIHGVEMFLEQGYEQFSLFTGYEAPKKVMKEALYKHFGWRND